jgi:hypothetical protein
VNTPEHGWLGADPDQLDRFAGELDELAGELERICARLADMASAVSPCDDPVTVRASAERAEDGDDRSGRPIHAVAGAINDMRQQALVARLAARDHRDTERSAGVDRRMTGERPT